MGCCRVKKFWIVFASDSVNHVGFASFKLWSSSLLDQQLKFDFLAIIILVGTVTQRQKGF